MDVTAVFEGLAAAANTITGLRTFAFAPDSIPEPAFFCVEVEIEYDKTFGRGTDQFLVNSRLLVSKSDDRSGQKRLQAYLKGSGPKSIKAALQADPTLGGACHSLHVQRVSGYGLWEHAGNEYLGAEFTTLIIGEGD